MSVTDLEWAKMDGNLCCFDNWRPDSLHNDTHLTINGFAEFGGEQGFAGL